MEKRSMERKLALLNQIERKKKRKIEQRYCTLEVTSIVVVCLILALMIAISIQFERDLRILWIAVW